MFSQYLDSILIELRPIIKEILALFILAFPVGCGLFVFGHFLFRFACFIRRKYFWNRKE